MACEMALPPPCTSTGFIPTEERKMTSVKKLRTASVSSSTLPPSLMTTYRPRNWRIQPSTSTKISALRTASSNPALRAQQSETPDFIGTCETVNQLR